MSYLQNNLLSNEQIVFKSSQNAIVFVPAAFWFIFSALVYIYFPPLTLVALLLLIGGCCASLFIWLTYVTSVFAVTNKRVIMSTGFFTRRSLELFLDKVEGIQVQQPLLGSFLNYGTITVVGTGGTQDYFDRVNQPLLLRRVVQEQIDKLRS